MKIGELSRRTGLPVGTLRYYESQGLLASRRSPGNYREFDEDTIAQVKKLQMYRGLSLSLEDIKELMIFSRTPRESCSLVCEFVERHRLKVAEQRKRLERLELELERLQGCCSGQGECKILREFDLASQS